MRNIYIRWMLPIWLALAPAAFAQIAEDEPTTTTGFSAIMESQATELSLPSEAIPERLQNVWETKLIGGDLTEITYGDLIEAALIFLFFCALIAVGRIVASGIVIPRLKKLDEATPSLAVDQALLALRKTKATPFFLLAIFLALRAIPLPAWFIYAFRILTVGAFAYQLIVWGEALLSNWLVYTKQRRIEADPSSVTALGALSFFGRIALWAVIIVLAIVALGLSDRLTPLLAGIGIGGIAIAFALQNILSDIFCSIAILLDKPFVVGDFIISGEQMGVVESIGIKTTRVRSLSGEQIIFPNADLIGSRIRNYKRMFERRVLFTIGVIYSTPADKLRKIPQIIREAVEAQEKTRFDRAHFARYGNFSLDFEAVYYVLDSNYNVYMDIHQAINLMIFDRFTAEGLEFAFPTQTLHVVSEENNGTGERKPVTELTTSQQKG